MEDSPYPVIHLTTVLVLQHLVDGGQLPENATTFSQAE
jgi:hypothetical protein